MAPVKRLTRRERLREVVCMGSTRILRSQAQAKLKGEKRLQIQRSASRARKAKILAQQAALSNDTPNSQPPAPPQFNIVPDTDALGMIIGDIPVIFTNTSVDQILPPPPRAPVVLYQRASHADHLQHSARAQTPPPPVLPENDRRDYKNIRMIDWTECPLPYDLPENSPWQDISTGSIARTSSGRKRKHSKISSKKR